MLQKYVAREVSLLHNTVASNCECARQEMKKYWFRGLVALVGAAIAAHVAPLLATHSEQDNCSFGAISNERYRALLAEAKRKCATLPVGGAPA
jgi:hypothetical protein